MASHFHFVLALTIQIYSLEWVRISIFVAVDTEDVYKSPLTRTCKYIFKSRTILALIIQSFCLIFVA